MLIIILSIVAKIKENKIAEIALKRLEESTHIPIVVNDVSLNIIRRFPLATIKLENVWVGYPENQRISDTLTLKNDTLAFIERLYVSVKSKPLIKGEIDVVKVEIQGLDFGYVINEQGIGNFDFLKDSTRRAENDTSSINLNVILKELMVKDAHCKYTDDQKHINAELDIPRVLINGKIEKENLYASANGLLKLYNCNVKNTKLYRLKETSIDFDMNYARDTVTLNGFNIETNGLALAITGNVVLKDTVYTDVRMQGKDISMAELYAFIPDKTLTGLGIKDFSGILDLDASMQGNLLSSQMPYVKMEIDLENGTVYHTEYPALKNISFSASVSNGKLRNNITTRADIRRFHAETEKGKVDLSLQLDNLDQIQYRLNSNIDVEIGEFKPYIPDSIFWDAAGHLQAKFTTKGVLPDSIDKKYVDYLLETSQLEMTLDNLVLAPNSTFSIDSLSGNLAYNLNHFTAHDLSAKIPSYQININSTSFDALLSGKVNDLGNMGIDLKSYQVKTDYSTLYGDAHIKNFKTPEFVLNSDLKLNVKEIKKFLPDSLVKGASGDITTKLSCYGKINPDSISDQLIDIVFKNSKIRLDFDKVNLESNDTLMNVQGFTGRIFMNPDELYINKLQGVYKSIEFNIDSTKVINLYKTIIENRNEKLLVEGSFKLGELNYSMFTPFMALNKDKTEVKNIPDNEKTGLNTKNYTWQIKGKLGIKSFVYENARADNITGLFNLSDSLYLVDQFKFDGFSGKFNTSVKYEIKDGKERMLWVKNRIEKINVVKLLKDFNNFIEFYDPPAITYKNISGIFTSKVDAQIYFEDDSLIRDKMYILGDSIKLEKGVIKNYKPVKEIEPLLPKGVGNLDTLEFKTINSNIFVFQDAINVPVTIIVSNRLDAKILGNHSFHRDYAYFPHVFLTLMTGKRDRLAKKQNEIGDEFSEKDVSNGIHLKDICKNGDCEQKIDLSGEWKTERDRIKADELLLKLRFHPNLVNYDTGVK